MNWRDLNLIEQFDSKCLDEKGEIKEDWPVVCGEYNIRNIEASQYIIPHCHCSNCNIIRPYEDCKICIINGY